MQIIYSIYNAAKGVRMQLTDIIKFMKAWFTNPKKKLQTPVCIAMPDMGRNVRYGKRSKRKEETGIHVLRDIPVVFALKYVDTIDFATGKQVYVTQFTATILYVENLIAKAFLKMSLK